jgi:superfamily II DNA helicase RecQ
MQVKIYTIPIIGGEKLLEEMNVFLRSKKILRVQTHLSNDPQGNCWCFCINYADDINVAERERAKVDYRTTLDANTFERFSKMRELRKRLATDEGVPAYAIFTDEELANMAAIQPFSISGMQSIKGIGAKKAERYGQQFLQLFDPA